jgi:hypothetical protein
LAISESPISPLEVLLYYLPDYIAENVDDYMSHMGVHLSVNYKRWINFNNENYRLFDRPSMIIVIGDESVVIYQWFDQNKIIHEISKNIMIKMEH